MHPDEAAYAESRRMAENGQSREAYLKVLELVAKGTALWQPYYEAGCFSLAGGHLEQAEKLLRAAVGREGEDHLATEALADLVAGQGKPEEGLQLWLNKLFRRGSLEVIQGFSRFVAEWQGPREGLESVFAGLLEGSRRNLQQVIGIARMGQLPRGREVIPAQDLPEDRSRYHLMKLPAKAADRFPAIVRYDLEKVVVRPHSDVPIWSGKALLPDHVDLDEHLLYDTLWGQSTPLPGGDRMAIQHAQAQTREPAGILLTSWTIRNWAHFLTELAASAALVETSGIRVDVPLLVSPALSDQFMDCLERVKDPRRPIKVLSRQTLVERAILFSPTALVPFDYLNGQCGRPVRYHATDNLFSPGALQALRDRVLGTGGRRGDGRVFIDRDSARRRLINRSEVVRAFREAGFEIVVPETMTFEAQLDLFSRAEVIAGMTGAGMANMVFAPKGARILVLAGNPVDLEPARYFPNMARSLGHELDYLAFGPPTTGIHIDFQVDLGVLRQHLKALPGGDRS